MRISTQQMFEIGSTRLVDLQSRLQKTQEQIASGRRILSPSDDPIAATRVLDVTQSQTVNKQYGVNRQYATNNLSQVEVTLGGVTELMQTIKETITTARNVKLGDSERAFMASELDGRLQQLLGLANTRDSAGNYVFSGFQSHTQPFVQTATGASYQGDLGQQKIQVDATRQMAVSTPGSIVFQSGGQDVFATLTDLVTLLNTPGTAGLTAGLDSADADMDIALDRVLTVRASVGANLQELEALDNVGSDRDLQYKQLLSELQDLDYTQAITQLTQQQVALEATQKTFAKTSSLSLFNFM
ncbi:flagellar hook-associated protein FlgL [Thiobacillus sp.]|uniref:flagellar hook-associated protein FlgL n=1 Tax=Thiobacillus sp. TaxID=924 RepID=UPI00286DCFA4|nr:flagellar hook-associated protein FlgL [Thiobacillus sp.]